MLFFKRLDEGAKNFKRLKFLKNELFNIGDIVEEESSITCYVSQRLLDRNVKKTFYDLYIGGMNTANKSKKELITYYGLEKPVHYIFDGITFNSPIRIGSYNCKLTFKNCSFKHSPITILQADKITFENNQYCDTLSNIAKKTFLRTTSSTTINELTFRKENFQNQYKPCDKENYFGMDICANKVAILDSKMTTDKNNGTICIKSKRIEILRSLLEFPEIYLDTDFVDVTRSKLKVEKGLVVGNDTNTCDVEINTDDVFSPYVVFNGIEWVNYASGNRTYYHDDPIKLKIARREWIETLNCIKEKYSTVPEEKKILELTKKYK